MWQTMSSRVKTMDPCGFTTPPLKTRRVDKL